MANPIIDYIKALGPLWTSRSGHTRPMALLSTPHLENILAYLEQHDHGDSGRADFAREELQRRAQDNAERTDEQDSSPPQELLEQILADVSPTRSWSFAQKRNAIQAMQDALRALQAAPAPAPLAELRQAIVRLGREIRSVLDIANRNGW